MTRQDVENTIAQAPRFSDDLRDAVQGFRNAVLEVLQAVEADPAKPQDLARRFGLNKNLTWKISKIVSSPDIYAGVPHMPGASAIRIFVKAMEREGAPDALLSRIREAAGDFDRVVEVHTGDRATLDIMVSDMLPSSAQSDQDEQVRKIAYQGNSGTWGVRAKVLRRMSIVAPNADQPDMADLVQIGGLVDFRRLRPDARWLLFRRERWSDDDPHPQRDVEESLDPMYPIEQGAPIIGAFCSQPVPTIDVVSGAGEDHYELPPGPVGNSAKLTVTYGQVSRAVGPLYGEHPGEYMELGGNIITPVENIVFDLLVHQSLDWAMNPEVAMYSRLDGGAMHATARHHRNYMPVVDPVLDLGTGLHGLATPLMPNHTKLAEYVFDCVKWDSTEFRAFRFAMAYPPIPTVAMLRSELPLPA